MKKKAGRGGRMEGVKGGEEGMGERDKEREVKGVGGGGGREGEGYVISLS